MVQLTRSIILYNGSDLTPSNDYTTDTDWTQTELGMSASDGDAGAATWLIRDESGVIPDGAGTKFLSGHNVVIATVGSNTLFRGRVAESQAFRGRQKAARAREISVTLEDQNSHLRGIVVHNWVRPAETDSARAQALVAAYLSGNPRATTNLNGSNFIITGSNAISLPAKTYTGVSPYEVMQELAQTTDKEMFVTVDNELAYFGHDYAGYDSLLRISDDPADANSVTYAPWNPRQSVVSRVELSALRSYYGTDTIQSTVRVTNSSATYQDYWEEPFWDSESVTAAEAAARAQAMLNVRELAEQSFTCAIGPMDGNQIYKIKPGQRISFKARAARAGRNPDGSFAGDTPGTPRIRSLTWHMPAEDLYIADLVLERQNRIKPPSKGSQALATQPRPAPEPVPDTPGTALFTWDFEGGNANDTTNTYDSNLNYHAAYALCPGGTACAYNDASSHKSDQFPVSAATDYTFAIDVKWRYNPAVRDIVIQWYNSSHVEIATTIAVVGAGHSTGVAYSFVATVTSPATAAYASWDPGKYAGTHVDNVVFGTAGTVTADDPYAVPDSGDSPYYMRSDDPRVLGLLDQMETVGFSWKAPVRVATTVAGTLASSFENGDTIDGVVLATGDRILLKDQAAGATNGIYTVNASGAPTRAVDFSSDDQANGAATFISEGTVNGNKVYVCTTDEPIILDTTALVFAQVSGSSGSVATDTIWDAAGDLAIGTGADTAARLAIGGSNTHLVSDGSTALWVSNTFGAVDALSAAASGTGDVTITGSLQDLTGATLSLQAGTYIIHGTFDVLVNNALNDRTFEGHLDSGGADQDDIAILVALGLANDRATINQSWRLVLASTTTVKLRGKYSGGSAGDFTSKGANTTIVAYRAGGTTVHDASSHTDRTRYITLHDWFDAEANDALGSDDAHGSLSGVWGHWDLENAATSTIRSRGGPWPSDFTAGTTPVLKFLWSSSAAANNVRWLAQIREVGDAATAFTTLLAGSATTIAAPAGADTTKLSSESFTVSPTAGRVFSVGIQRQGADAADTNTGTVSLWEAWIEYTADG